MRIVVCALLLLLGPASFAKGGPVRANPEWEPGYYGHWRYHERPLVAEAPAGVKLPDGVASARYGSIELSGDRVIHLVIDVAAESHRIWVDSDLDGDLAEEKPRTWVGSDTVRTRDTVRLEIAEGQAPLPVDFTFWRPSLETVDTFSYLANIHRAGSVVLAGRLRRFAVVDGNGDFRFDDAEHDRIFFDVDGSGLASSNRGTHEQLRIGEPFHVRGLGFVAEIPDPLASAVTFKPVVPAPPARPRFHETWEPSAPRSASGKASGTLAELEGRLEGADLEARSAVMREAGQLGTPEAFAFLERMAQARGAAVVRQWAIDSMGYTNYRAFAARLAEFTDPSQDPKLRILAMQSLYYMDAPGREKLYYDIIRGAKSKEDRELVSRATRFLALSATPQSRKQIVQAMKAQKDRFLRLEIYRIASHGDPGGLQPALVKAALADRYQNLRGEALEDYWGYEPAKARALALRLVEDKEVTLRALLYPAIDILGYHGDKKGVEALLFRADIGSNKTWLRILNLLAPVRDPAALRVIADGLKSRSPDVRSLCAHVLESNRSDFVVVALAKASRKEKEPDVLWRLATALSNQTGDKAVTALLRLGTAKKVPTASRSIALAALARIGFGHPKVARMFLSLLGSSRWEDRIFALDAVARSGDTAAAFKILPNIDHKVWQVRIAAAQALRQVRVVEAIPVLIARLEKEQERRIRIEIANTLFHLTGKEFYDDADGWRRWWAQAAEGFQVPAEPPRRVVRPGATVARFYNVPVVSDRVCFVLDKSGSMRTAEGHGTRFARAVKEVTTAVGKLGRRARCNVILFNSSVSAWRKKLTIASKSNRELFNAYVAAAKPGGETNLYGALLRAFGDETVDTVFLLSDGAPNKGVYTHPDAILREIRALNATRRVALHTISVGRDSDLLRRLAEENGGTYARR